MAVGCFYGPCLAAPADDVGTAKGKSATSERSANPVRSKPVKRASKPQAKALANARKAELASGRPSYGKLAGLHSSADPLDLKSSVALVVDQETDQVLFSKNPSVVLPIASITKLMTALVVLEAGLPLDERLTISQEDVDTEKGSGSRLRVGTTLSRGDMLNQIGRAHV